MILNRIAIRQLLLLTAAFIGFMLILIGIVTNKYLRQSFRYFDMLTEIEKVQSVVLSSMVVEKDYRLNEVVNEMYFSTGESSYIDDFKSYSNDVSNALSKLAKSDIIQSVGLSTRIDSTIKLHKQYTATFDKITALIRQRGFKSFGLIGEFRKSIHSVESQFSALNSYYFTSQMLTLRRHEKDYLLRKDLSYQNKFQQVLNGLVDGISNDRSIKNPEELVALLHDYGVLFNSLIDVDEQLGFSNDEGMFGQLKRYGGSVNDAIVDIHSNVYNYSKSKIDSAVLMLFIFVGLLSIFTVVVILLVSRHVVGSIKRLQSYITLLGKGELPASIEVKSNDEIAQMELSINILTENLRNTRDFANEVGNGNLESAVNVFGNKGELGGALIEMRKKLLQVAKEQEQQDIETNRRLWANEGMALFTDILRSRDKSMEDFAFDIVKNLVKYTSSSLASLFMMSIDEDDKPCLNLLATYAYDRRKFVNSRLYLNEGLVGVCALEAETTLLTEIPKDYIKINSGLGYAAPTCIILVPLKVDQKVVGVIEMATFNIYQPFEVEFIERVMASTASTLQMVTINNQTRLLLEQTQQQAEELQAQEEEMRQNMEEMRTTQEWMNSREEELKSALLDKEAEIKRVVAKAEQEKKLTKEKISTLESMFEFYNQSFLVAELNHKGEIKMHNDKFGKIMSSSEGKEIHSIFDNSIAGYEQANRMEWERVVNGETYKGFIHRMDSMGNQIAIYAIFSPVFNCFGQVDKVLFIGLKVGQVEDSQSGGIWFKDDGSALMPIDFKQVLLS
jgi:signal transduction histidine kinase